jgi:hypothetical protein
MSGKDKHEVHGRFDAIGPYGVVEGNVGIGFAVPAAGSYEITERIFAGDD